MCKFDTLMRVIMKHLMGKLFVVRPERQQSVLERITLSRIESRGRLPLEKVIYRLIR